MKEVRITMTMDMVVDVAWKIKEEVVSSMDVLWI